MKLKLVNPFTASKLDGSTVIGALAWGLFIVMITALTQNVAKWIGMRTPIDTSISGNPMFSEPAAVVSGPTDSFV